jgi:hypothetical protein
MSESKSLYERLAVRFIGEGGEADRRVYITVLDPNKAKEYADAEIVSDALKGGIPNVKGPDDVVFFEDNSDLHVFVKSTNTVWVPSMRSLGSWDDVTDNFDDVTLNHLASGGASRF